MLLARVLGTARATMRHRSLDGWRLLIVQPLAADETTPDGNPLVVVDPVSAGRGDMVMLTSDGRHTRELVGSDKTPARWSVLGIRDP